MDNIIKIFYKSPLGCIKIEAEGDAITGLVFDDAYTGEYGMGGCAVLQECTKQLDAYFAGELRIFNLPLTLRGTAFRQSVWAELLRVPYGETRSYRDVALALDKPGAVRAVGGANHHNPVSIIVPCHRIIGADGELTGYGGGLWRKEWLLRHEKDSSLRSYLPISSAN